MKDLKGAVITDRPINLKWPNRNQSDREIDCATTVRIMTEMKLYALPVFQVISSVH